MTSPVNDCRMSSSKSNNTLKCTLSKVKPTLRMIIYPLNDIFDISFFYFSSFGKSTGVTGKKDFNITFFELFGSLT